MAKVAFTKLKLKSPQNTTKVAVGDVEFEVLNYLPIEDKINLIDISLEQSYKNGGINPLALDLNFYVNIVFKYTNLSFTDNQRDDKGKIYDLLNENGVLKKILAAIPKDEYDALFEAMEEAEQRLFTKNNALAPQISEFMEVLPIKMKEAAEIAKDFNPEEFKNVIQFTRAANGDRPLE